MGVVLDANIVNEYFRVELGYAYSCTECPRQTLEALQVAGVTFVVDDGGHMVHEWQATVDYDWFQNWYMTFVQVNKVTQFVAGTYRTELKHLQIDFGFPATRDTWLIRVALTDASRAETGPTRILSEDMDLFDPKNKANAQRRQAIMSGSTEGPMAKHLRKKWQVQPCSVAVLLALL